MLEGTGTSETEAQGPGMGGNRGGGSVRQEGVLGQCLGRLGFGEITEECGNRYKRLGYGGKWDVRGNGHRGTGVQGRLGWMNQGGNVAGELEHSRS